MMEWISVNDQMPNELEPVLVFEKRVTVGFWINIHGNQRHVIYGNSSHKAKFTHWKPLPSPPNQEV